MWISCAILAFMVMLYVLRPLFERTAVASTGMLAETERDHLINRKTALYRNIRDLEFEHGMGRLSQADFQQLEMVYRSEAMEILKKLDRLSGSETASETTAPRPNSKQKTLTDSCPACGAKIIQGKKFCADCGARL